MKSVLALLCVLACVLASPAFAAGRAGDLNDAEPCLHAYLGIGESVDYNKAYKCFDSQHIYQYLIIMQLNGQGTKADLSEARKTMQDWLAADPDNADSLDETAMQKLLDTYQATPDGNLPKVDYCKDVAGTTPSISFCTWLDGQIQAQGFKDSMASIRSKLSRNDAALLDGIQRRFDTFVKAEGERGSQMLAGGSASGVAYSQQQIAVRRDFQELMESAFLKQTLAPASKEDLAKAETDLRGTYAEDIAAYKDMYSSYDDNDPDPSHKEFNNTMSGYVMGYEDDVKKSRKSWEALRNQCADLAARAYNGKQQGVDWSISMKAAMTRQRIAEIKAGWDY